MSAAEKIIDLEAVGSAAVSDYYHPASEKFLVRNKAGRWLPHSAGSYKRILAGRGIRTKADQGVPLSDADQEILEVQDEFDVHGFGPLCGRNAGFIDEGGFRYLVTEDMSLIEPRPGPWPTIEAFIVGLLHTSEREEIGARQLNTFLGWLQSSVAALREGRYQQQQALALCGGAGCGKSFLQHQLITPCLAGREADAKLVFLRGNEFNSALFKAEHLYIDDNLKSLAIRDRVAFGATLKEYTVGASTKGLHGKGREELTIRPWWRISITLNDEPEALSVLPPLDENVADKLILLRASRFTFPAPGMGTPECREVMVAKIRDEIPGFLHWLLNEYEIPEECANPNRYNVRTFHHPELKEELEVLSPERELLELIDLTFDCDLQSGPVRLTASRIEERIRLLHERRVDRILRFSGACAKYLHRLSVKNPGRIAKARTSGANYWDILPKPDGSGGCGG